jgi:hypothetical protein
MGKQKLLFGFDRIIFFEEALSAMGSIRFSFGVQATLVVL